MEIKITFLDNFKVLFLHVCFEIIRNTCKPVLQPNCIFVKTVHLKCTCCIWLSIPWVSAIYTGTMLKSVLCGCWCFMALWHILGHFGRGQLSYPHCSWTSLLGSLQVLSAHSFANNWQLPFLKQRKGENGRKKYFMTNLHERMLPDVRIEPTTVRIPGRRASDRVIAPGSIVQCSTSYSYGTVKQWACCRFSLKFYRIECFTAGQDHFADFKLS